MAELSEKYGFIIRHKALLSLFGLTLVLKVIMLLGTDVVSNDGPTYLNISKQFLDHKLNFLEAFRGSSYFYPALVALLSRLVPGNTVDSLISGGQLLSLLFSVFSIIPFYLLVERIWSSRAAFWSGLIFCVAPGINRYAVDVMRDPGYLLCFLWAIYLAYLFMKKHRLPLCLGAVVFSGLAFLFRVEAFVLVVLLLFWCLSSFILDKIASKWLFRCGLVFLVLAVLAGMVSLYANSEFGSSSRLGQVASGASQLKTAEIFDYNDKLKPALDNAGKVLAGTSHGNDFFAIAKENIRLIYLLGVVTLIAKVAFLPFFILALGGIVWAVRNRIVNWYLLSILAAYLTLGFFYNMNRNFLEERYVYSVVVTLYAYAGYGLAELLDRFKGRFPAGSLFITVFFLVLVPSTTENFKIQKKRQTFPFKEAGLWLGNQPEIGRSRILANERKVPFYAGKYDNYKTFDSRKLEKLSKNIEFINRYDYITIEEGIDYKQQIVELENFQIVKQFESDRYYVVIYKNSRIGTQ